MARQQYIAPLTTEDGFAMPFSFRKTEYVQDVGMIDWGLETPAITVGGGLRFALYLRNLSPRATIWKTSLMISQKFELQELEPGAGAPFLTPQLMPLSQRGDLPKLPFDRKRNRDVPLWDGDEVKSATRRKPEESLSVEETVRLPDEDTLRPSTNPG